MPGICMYITPRNLILFVDFSRQNFVVCLSDNFFIGFTFMITAYGLMELEFMGLTLANSFFSWASMLFTYYFLWKSMLECWKDMFCIVQRCLSHIGITIHLAPKVGSIYGSPSFVLCWISSQFHAGRGIVVWSNQELIDVPNCNQNELQDPLYKLAVH